MKKLFTVLILILSFQSLYSSPKSFIKLYFNNGNPSQVFLIDDIGKMAIKKFSNNFTLTVYYQKSLSAGYQTSSIDTMKFEKDTFNIYLSGSIKPYLVYDIDSIIFRQNFDAETVTICKQVWMKKNLDVDHYRNGDSIPEVRDSATWENLTTGAWCYYDNEPANGKIYSKLYNRAAVNDPRGLTPVGWHLPSVTEWTEMINCLGGEGLAKDKLKSTGTISGGDGLWNDLYYDNYATNSSGFSALPSGVRDWGRFISLGFITFWWFAPGTNYYHSWFIDSGYNLGQSNWSDKDGFSVRCVRDK